MTIIKTKSGEYSVFSVSVPTKIYQTAKKFGINISAFLTQNLRKVLITKKRGD